MAESKVYTVSKIEGDYATLREEESGEELLVAMALLPIGADLSDRVEYLAGEFALL